LDPGSRQLSRCVAVVLRAIETDLIQRADLARAFGARTGAVTVVQRFGSALNLNVHRHMVVESSSEQPRCLSYS
jgi:hypothetical protein